MAAPDISLFQQFKDWLYSGIIAILQKLESVVLSFFDMLKDVFFWIVDTVMGFGVTIISGFSFAADWNPGQYISALPPDVVNMLGLIGLGQCLSLIASAILIRLVLQLIPFTRLGS